ncbi:CdaR family transcriptional regulator [Metabacillus herbersteinensis]|uniref:CdaR family transcriptional regulator n=1 Tax=Metabacillus herbersteinensis TaxID=283816 RepID=A0ABV6GHG1_9BACI
MLLLPFLAKKIVSEVEKLLDEDIIIVNVEGIIIAGTEEKRVGTFHGGSLICVKEKRKVLITKEDEKKLKGVKSGLNLPIFFSQEVIGVIGITGEAERVLPFGEILKKMTELLIQENYYADQMQWHTRMVEAFVIDWLQLNDWSPVFLERANLLNINLNVKRQVMLAYVEKHQQFSNQELQQLTHIWNGQQGDDVLIHWGNDRLLIIQRENKDQKKDTMILKVEQLKSFIEETWNTAVAFGIGQAVKSNELYRTYQQAERALTVAMEQNSIVFEEDLRLEMCLGEISHSTRKEFSKRVLKTVLANKELLETFQLYFQKNMSLKSTASSMHIHINTLHYRIKKMEELTGLNFKNFPDVVTLYLALYFLDDDTKNNPKN